MNAFLAAKKEELQEKQKALKAKNQAMKALKDGHNQVELTNRESEVLREIAKGKTNKEIAHILNLSVRTIESHRSSIREKSGGGNAAALAKLASDLGLI